MLSDNVKLPVEAVTETFGVLGQRGTGKTNAAVVLVEEMVAVGGNVVIADPVGAHWGITREGTGPGIPGIVIGGEHADVPLEKTGGKLVADLVVQRNWPVVVVDMKLLRKGAQRQFMADFLETLFHDNRDPLHVVFEEADRALPQNPREKDPYMSRTLGAGEDIVKLGRSRGLGCTLVSQRPATVNKNVLEQVESLLLFRVMGPNDRKAIKAWIEANGDPDRTDDVMNSLGTLKRGEAWLYSPAFLERLERVDLRLRETFDSSSTPKVGGKAIEPTDRAPVDLDVLRDRMAETIEEAKANDPAELKRQVRELTSELRKRETAISTLEEQLEGASRPAIPDELIAQINDLCDSMPGANDAIRGQLATYDMLSSRLLDTLRNGASAAPAKVAEPSVREAPRPAADAPPPRVPRAAPAPREDAEPTEGVSSSQQRILDAIAALEAIGVQEPTKLQVALFSEQSPKSSGFQNNLGRLRTLGYITYPPGKRAALTAAGRQIANKESAPRDMEEMHEYVRRLVSEPQWKLLHILIRAYPNAMLKEDLAEAADVSQRSSGYQNNLGGLRSLGLLDYPAGGEVVATPTLMMETP